MSCNKTFSKFAKANPPYVQWVSISGFPLLIDDPTRQCPQEVLIASSSLLALFAKSF